MKYLLAIPAILFGAFGYAFVLPEYRMHEALQPQIIMNPREPAVVMLGDSHFEHLDWKIVSGCQLIANLGVTGETTSQILARLPQALAMRPKFVFLDGGTNDPYKGLSVQQTLANLEKMKVGLNAAGVPFSLIAPPPSPRYPAEAAEISKAATLRVQLSIDDIGPDKLHLTRNGYWKLLNALQPTIDRYCN